MNIARKLLGEKSEKTIDAFQKSRGWDVVVSNHRFKGGEIDRVYKRPASEKNEFTQFIVSEIKGYSIMSALDLKSLRHEMFWKRFFKPRQIRNLERAATILLCSNRRTRIKPQILMRLYVVVWVAAGDVPENFFDALLPGRQISLNRQCLLIALSPEFIGSGKPSGQFQMRVH